MGKAKYCKNCGWPVRENPYITGPTLMHFNPSHSGIREDHLGCGNGTVAEMGEEVEYDYLPPNRVDVPRRVIILSDEDIMNNLLKETAVDNEEILDENEFDNEIAIEVRTPTKSLTLSKLIKGRKAEDVRGAVRDLMSDVHAVYGLDH